jgi:uncharacterized membrane protein
MAIGVWFALSPLLAIALLALASGAAVTSLVLAYSLLFITRRSCPYCWTSHVVNWTLLLLYGWLFFGDILSPRL